MTDSTKFVRFTSHRARARAWQVLGFSRENHPQGYYSWSRETGPGGVYRLTSEQVEQIKGQHLVNFTLLRGPYDDLMKCW